MPIAKFQMPDGRIARFEVPEGTSQQDAERQVMEMVGKPETFAPSAPKAPQISERDVPPPPPPPAPQSNEFAAMGGKQPEAPQDSLAGYIPRSTGMGRTLIDRMYNGATLANLGDEIQAVGGAAVASPVILAQALMRDDGLKSALKQANPVDLYNSGLDIGRGNKEAQFEESPVLSTVAEIGGSLATGIPAAKAIGQTALGAKTASTLRSGVLPNATGTIGKAANYASRVAAGGAVGGATSAAAGFGAGEGGIENRIDKAKEYAPTGAVLGAAFPVVADTVKGAIKGASNVKRGMGARGAEALDEVVGAAKQSSRNLYQEATKSGVSLNKSATQSIFQKVQNALSNDGITDPDLHRPVVALLKRYESDAKQGALTIEHLDNLRKLAGDVAGNFNDPASARKAGLIRDALDDAMQAVDVKDISNQSKEAIDALGRARKEWGRALKLEKISDIVKKADGDPNKLKSGLNSLLNRKGGTRGFSTEEIAALKNASKYTTGEGIMKMFGKFGLDIGTRVSAGNAALPVLSSGALAAATGAPTAGATLAGGTVARQLQKYLARGKAEQLLQVIEAGGKVAEKEVMKLPPPIAMMLMQNNLVAASLERPKVPVR